MKRKPGSQRVATLDLGADEATIRSPLLLAIPGAVVAQQASAADSGPLDAARDAMSISLKRAYEAPLGSDGCRILVERLWPRGLSKQKAKIDLWPKEAAPSAELRRWFQHDPDKWAEFKRRYFKELRSRKESLEPILERVRAGRVTFVFASRETRFNNAVALKEYVERTI